MLDTDYMSWDECPEETSCELVLEFFALVDTMVKDIQHLEAEAIRARYALRMMLDPKKEWITTGDLLSGLISPYGENLAYKEFMRIYYDGGDPLSFKHFIDAIAGIAEGRDTYMY